MHGPGCGHEAVPHDSHIDYLVSVQRASRHSPMWRLVAAVLMCRPEGLQHMMLQHHISPTKSLSTLAIELSVLRWATSCTTWSLGCAARPAAWAMCPALLCPTDASRCCAAVGCGSALLRLRGWNINLTRPLDM